MKNQIRQNWQMYTQEDHEVWRILFERQHQALQSNACSLHLDCLNQSDLTKELIPNFNDLNRTLMQKTNWEITVVDGIIPVHDFMQLLAKRKFCSSTWLRKKHQLDYLEEPDMFHDIFGHIPLLYDEQYADFAQQFGLLGLNYLHNPTALSLLERLYWFTIEFGLIREKDTVKIYGAGLLSSYGETQHVMYNKSVHWQSFSIYEILLMPFRNDQIQTTYFVLESWQQLSDSLQEAREIINDLLLGKIDVHTFQLDKQMGSIRIV
jgi:phenylalanine-4-hydroxylase